MVDKTVARLKTSFCFLRTLDPTRMKNVGSFLVALHVIWRMDGRWPKLRRREASQKARPELAALP